MASVSGSRIGRSCPGPASVWMSMRPRSASMLRRTTSMPTPRPGDLGDLLGGREAGLEDQLVDVGRRQLRARRHQAAARSPWPGSARGRGRAPSSAISMTMLPPWWEALRRRRRPAAGLPARGAPSARLDAVVDAVADHVHQRVVDVLDHLAIELGLLALQHQLDRLAGLAAEVADQPRHLWNVWRIGTMRIDIALRCRSLVMRFSCARLRVEALVGRPRSAGSSPDQRLRDDELADHVDQVVELAGVDLHRARAPRRARVAHRGAAGSPRPTRRSSAAASAAASGRAAVRRWRLLPPAIERRRPLPISASRRGASTSVPGVPAATRAGSSRIMIVSRSTALQHDVELARPHRVAGRRGRDPAGSRPCARTPGPT